MSNVRKRDGLHKTSGPTSNKEESFDSGNNRPRISHIGLLYNMVINHEAFEYYGRLRKVRDYVELHYSEHLSLTQVAEVACMESAYFSVYFRKKVGLNFTAWLSRFRVEKAIELMRLRDFSICEIALAVGYQDLSTFVRAFKRHTGITPREIRRLVMPLPLPSLPATGSVQ